ncbi:MAG: DEAD/DEAH box helicase family protein [Candidatus Cloacimonetes bacterium]|nr:DEAD/DEAH box helicase family protein [Candidatus Cloacimonadota bacterium]
MARLFGLEYHELSNSWFFKSSVIKLKKEDIIYRKYLDEVKNVIFKFEAISEKKKKFFPKVEITYNKKQKKIIQHFCSECGEEDCRHYLSIINYSYNFLSTDLLKEQVVQTYHTKFLKYNEYWQRTVLNAKIEIESIYDNNTDKIRIYLNSYKPLNVRLISILCAEKEYVEEDISFISQAEKQLRALSEAEINLFKILQENKCSFSRKGLFFTIYKNRFINFFSIFKSLQNKTFIKETGDRIIFSEEEFHINFQVNKIDDENYVMKISNAEKISAIFVGRTTYIFKKNVIYPIDLPFTDDVTAMIFTEGLNLNKTDLVYLYSVVARQLGLIKCYLDFDEDIEIPEVYHNTPIITYDLNKDKNRILMKGFLDYADGVVIPMSAVRFPVELVRFDQDGKVSWFYIPPQIKYQIFNFIEKLPESKTSQLEKNSQLIFEGEENIENLKKAVFEFADPAWSINLSEELKNEFVYKVKLQPVIRTRSSGKVNWFEYEVEYNFKDISFSHEEIKKFFKTKEKFLKLKDGRFLFFENTIAFNEIEKLLKKSTKISSAGYKLSIYNLPYVYQLHTVNNGIKIFGDKYLEEMYTSIIKRKLIHRTILPNILNAVMRSYQKAGHHWLIMLQSYGLAGILADDMGLGKTVQAISILSVLPSDSCSMVICPKTLLYNWAAEIEKFNPGLSYILYEGTQDERKEILENRKVNILFASYSIIQNDIEQLSQIEFDYIILDEAQHIKNAAALRTKSVKKLNSKYKMSLSGTPIENNALELWSIFDFLMPGYLPSMRSFKNEYLDTIKSKKESQDKLKMLVSPFILRRKKKDVLIELPDKQEQIAYCKLSQAQEKMYLQILENVKEKFSISNNNIGSNYIHILAALTKLRQICNHPALIDGKIKHKIEFSGKLELLNEIVIDAVENGKKLLIFSQFVQMLKLLREVLKKAKIRFEYMDGSTRNRQKIIENFNNNNSIRAFLISLKTGGFGLNLTAADTVIIVDPWWNPMGENQAIDRAHRIGQTKKVMVYKMITKGTIEEKIQVLQQNKTEMFENIIDDGQNVIKNMDVEQLRKLLEY